MQIAPRDVPVRSRLASLLAEHRHLNEAREHYWRCFELSGDLGEKLSLVSAMTELATKTGDYEALLEKLRQLRRRQEEPKVLTLCLVEALRQGNRYSQAKRELTELLSTRTADVDTLKQLTALAAGAGDWQGT